MSILIFPQLKYLGRIYISQNYLEYKNYPTRTPNFEEIADTELSRQCYERYNTTRVSLFGYNYTQYNENGWSSYPAQLVVKGKLLGIVWIRWQNRNCKDFFIINKCYDRHCNDYPVNFVLCSDAENKMLAEKYPQPVFDGIVCSSKYIRLSNDITFHDMSNSFVYEYQRQMSQQLVEFTGSKEILKNLIIRGITVGYLENDGVYTYSMAPVKTKSKTDNTWHMIAIRWHSAKCDRVISVDEEVDSESIVFEIAESVPFERIRTQCQIMRDLNGAEKLADISQCCLKPQRVPVETYFPVYIEKLEYPDVKFIIKYSVEVDDNVINNLHNTVGSLIMQYNEQCKDKIHDYDIKPTSNNSLVLYIDFGNADANALLFILENISNTISCVNQIFIS